MNTRLRKLGISIPATVNLIEILEDNNRLEDTKMTEIQKEKIKILKGIIDEYNKRPLKEPTIIKNSTDCYKAIRNHFRDLSHEELHAVLLRGNKLKDSVRISSGSWDSVLIDPRQIIIEALNKKCNSVILVHNHPSENPLPSESDIKQTQKIRNAMKCMEINLLDHIIVTPDSFYSFADETIHKILDR